MRLQPASLSDTELRIMQKAMIVAHLNALLEERAAILKAELAETLEARNTDTKSSAGDKHEVGRAMVQQELDQLEARSANVRSMQQELARVPLDRVYDQVAFGSLVNTDQGIYFFAIPMGAVILDGKVCYAVSVSSPIGLALKDKRVGSMVPFNGRSITITAIA